MSEKILSPALRDELRELLREVLREEADIRPAPVSREWVKAEELAKEFDIKKSWLEERGRRGELARCKVGKHNLIRRADVERYLADRAKREVDNES